MASHGIALHRLVRGVVSPDLTDVCKQCPDGADTCFRSTIVVSEGYWRINEAAEVSKAGLAVPTWTFSPCMHLVIDVLLCCAVLCCAVLCCAVLCCDI